MRNRRGVRRRGVAPIAIAEVPLGVAAGAAVGAFAGPPGLIAGAIVGSVIGAVLAIGHNREMHLQAMEEERMDRDLGIIWGDIGAPNLRHPPATHGLYSANVIGSEHTSSAHVAEGPINPPSR